MTRIRQAWDADGIAVWRFETEDGRPVTLNRAALEALEALIATARNRPGLRGILLSSAVPGVFIAGADLDEMRAVLSGPDPAKGAREASALGHRVFTALESLSVPTVAVIAGACMGGGTELALACRHRVVADDPDLRIALPEVKLGILPGWGGCTRLPRRVGLVAALDVILAGKELRPAQARKLGLADAVVPPEGVEASARRFLEKALAGKLPPRKAPGSWMLEGNPLGRALVFRKAAATVLAQTGGHYPAPLRALETVRRGLEAGPEAGYAAEEAAIGDLVATPVARHLVGLFFMTQENKRYTGGIDAAPRAVRSMGIVGAGLMGSGIAEVAASRGLAVRLKDVSGDALAKGLSRIAGEYRKRVKRRAMTEREFSRRMGRIATGTGWEGLQGADLVVEAVLEKLELKRKVLAEFQAVNTRGIFASNTSTLPIGAIAEGAKDPSRVVGMHFFNPVPRMPLVEVIPGPSTSPEVTATTVAAAKKLGKFVVVVKDRPGFLVNRVLTPYLLEAGLMVEEGIPMDRVDAALRRFGMPMGPVELIQHVGQGVAQHAGQVMLDAFPDRLQGSELLKRLGATVPLYLGEGRHRRPNPAVHAEAEAVRRARGAAPALVPDEKALQERLVMAMVNEAAWALGEGVVATPHEVDLAMIFGTGFAPFRGGLLRHADAVGTRACLEAVERLQAAHGRRFTPAPFLADLARSGRAFYPG